MHASRTTLATLAAIGATLPVAIPTAAQARPDAPPTSSLAGTTSATVAPARSVTDLRSPDARDAATPRGVDLRSPDAREAATATQGASTASGAPVAVRATAGATEDGAVDWGDVAIYGGAVAAVLVLCAAGLLAGQRRRDHQTPATSR